MTNGRSEITDHYSLGGLRAKIEAGLRNSGKPASVETLSAVDEFHVGGRAATVHLVTHLGLAPGDRVLDVGSGLGGTARYMAKTAAAAVTGVDLTKEYVDVACWLTELVGLSDSVGFHHGTVVDLPSDESDFAAATMVHVGMNVADKSQLFADVAQRLGPRAVFGIYDLMSVSDAPAHPAYPVPWATTAATSFLETATHYVAALEACGFGEISVIDRTDAAIDAFAQLAAANSAGPSALALHLVMGPDAPTKIANLVAAIRGGLLAPTEIIARR